MAKFHEELFSDPDTATGLNKVRRIPMGLALVASWLTTPPDIRQSIDFKAVTKYHDDKLTVFNDEWKEKFAENDTSGKCNPPCPLTIPHQNCAEPSYAFRSSLLPLCVDLGLPAF